MKKRKPIALWKSIVGVSTSAAIILTIGYVLPFRAIYGIAVAEIVIYSILLALGVFLFIVNLISLVQTLRWKARRIEEEGSKEEAPASAEPSVEPSSERTELLHRLLAEGKITNEEYDVLIGK